ncbi:hypothetical protein AJ78_08370 [Emergomyces pasteurianus Ep9510]|uniref:Chromo domain-containing protein n=1 Tax=Emergomyces pasteurianus Ep9510 TaxID=1447872 RepID=A0A1J9Q437_9EURO|nr:hypothetical protein AJ78_08370 [Emergomyces pasteurianus Ep9510]
MNSRNLIEAADNIVTKLRDARDWAKASMTSVKQDLKNIQTTRPSRTLDYRHAKYEVLKVLDSHNYCLNTLSDIYNPPGIMGEDNELEWEIEDILDEQPRGRGRQYLVKWVSYDRSLWTSGSALSEAAALDR